MHPKGYQQENIFIENDQAYHEVKKVELMGMRTNWRENMELKNQLKIKINYVQWSHLNRYW